MQKHINKAVALLCCLVLLAGLIPSVAAAPRYTIDSWAKVEVEAMDALGLIPHELAEADLRRPITRRLMCQIAVLSYERLTGKTMEMPQAHPFTDTTEAAVEKAQAGGLIHGDGNGKFRPNDTLTRQEFFCIVGNFLRVTEFPLADDMLSDLKQFQDLSEVTSWALPDTQLCVGVGVVLGTGSKLEPLAQATAQEAILMFYRGYIMAEANQAPASPEDIPGNNAPPSPPPFQEAYPDADDWALPEIKAMDAQGLIPNTVKGTSMRGDITRGNMCKIAVLAYKHQTGQSSRQPQGGSPFRDTSDPDIVLAAELGIVNGYTDGTFGAEKSITREEFFRITANFLAALGYPKQDDASVNLSVFKDSNQVSSWAKSAARLLVGLDILKGSDGKLFPQTNIVCQEAIALFHRSCVYMSTWEAPPPASETASKLVSFAMQFKGYPYVYGGQSPSGFDCSGLVWYVYRQFGYSLNRTANSQYNNGTRISRNELLPGDLVFFSTNGYPIGHVGIYIGDDMMIHASNSRTGVILSDLNSSYYASRYYGAVRIIER